LQLEPIGLVFVAFFALILIIQFIAMLFHRFGTLSHILASTELFDCGKDVDPISADGNVEKDGVRLIRKFQKLKNLDGEIIMHNWINYFEFSNLEDSSKRLC